MVNKQKTYAPPEPRKDPKAKPHRSSACLLAAISGKKKHEKKITKQDCTKPNADHRPLTHQEPDQGSSHPWPYGEEEREGGFGFVWVDLHKACSMRHCRKCVITVCFCILSNILVCLAYTEASHKSNEEKCMLTTRLRAVAWWLIQSESVMSTKWVAQRPVALLHTPLILILVICSIEKQQELGRTKPTAFLR